MSHRGQGRGRAVASVLGALFAVTSVAVASADSSTLYVLKDKAELIAMTSEPVTRVAVTNPGIADVVVLTPTQLLVSGKAVGVTSLMLFVPNGVRRYDLVVQPTPADPVRAPLVPSAAHSVVVQRGGKAARQLFVPDTTRSWVELGPAEVDGEAAKK